MNALLSYVICTHVVHNSLVLADSYWTWWGLAAQVKEEVVDALCALSSHENMRSRIVQKVLYSL